VVFAEMVVPGPPLLLPLAEPELLPPLLLPPLEPPELLPDPPLLLLPLPFPPLLLLLLELLELPFSCAPDPGTSLPADEQPALGSAMARAENAIEAFSDLAWRNMRLPLLGG
jgi:hypothetical protein